MDGDREDDVAENKIRKLTRRQAEDRLRGKKFYDKGDYDLMISSRDRSSRRRRGVKNFEKGEFTVLVWDPKPTENPEDRGYWCERDNVDDLSKDRQIELFQRDHVEKLVREHDDE